MFLIAGSPDGPAPIIQTCLVKMISNLNKETIVEACSVNKIPEEISKMLTKILEECESARYAPISNEDSFKTLKESKSIITKIEAHAKV